MDAYDSEKLEAYLANLFHIGESSRAIIQPPSKRAKLTDCLDKIDESKLDKVIKTILCNKKPPYAANSRFTNGFGVNQYISSHNMRPPSVLPELSGQLFDTAETQEVSQELPELHGPLFESEAIEKSQVDQETTDTLPNLEGVLFPGETHINVVRDEIVQKVLESSDKFKELDDKYKDLNQSQLIAERPIDLAEITDPKLRQLLEQFKFIKIAGIDSLGEWKQVAFRQNCQILLNTENADEFVKAFDEISEFIHHGEYYFLSILQVTYAVYLLF